MSKIANISVERTGTGKGTVTATTTDGKTAATRFNSGFFDKSEAAATRDASRRALKR